ncbi:MAG TPA: hypothetical protein VIW78_13775 [Burkholderiales bacterium]
MTRWRALAVLAIATTIVWAAPLAGLAIAGQPIAAFVGFPPRTTQIAQMPFAWGAFIALALPALGALAVFGAAIAAAGKARPPDPGRAAGRFPWWGWLGAASIAAVWPIAWSEGLAAPAWRAHSFSVLWLGYILAMNGLAWRASGASLLTHRTHWFLALFVLSAGFWWLFEYVNQFVHDWHYGGVEAMSDGEYFIRATLPFATVLPAVASTWSWLGRFPRLEAMSLPAVRGRGALAWIALAAGAIALAATGLRPDLLFPMLWIAPVLVLAGLQHLAVGETVFSPLARGDWRPVLQPALAALVCGFFWELWNYGSLPQWHYSIPYVQRFQLFEMPALGYAGYLPFGIECALVMDLAARIVERRALWPLEGEANPR